MILVTVGTSPFHPFDRLMGALGQLSSCDLIVQYGPATPPPGVAEAYQWLSFDQVLAYMREAETVISHAGSGTIICASNMGHVPVVVPRLKRFGEAVDDHQVELAAAFERTGRVSVVWDLANLRTSVERSSKSRAPVAPGDGRLQEAVRAALMREQPRQSAQRAIVSAR